ncbi:MAG: hypothetical protein K5682_02210 [Lachnospiraceae bacterium]|nr:hypothetical protein [Lachnospiraceae bacterium]
MDENKWIKPGKFIVLLSVCLLLLYPLRHICYGAEFTDTGYSLGNYRFYEHMDGMWVFATYLANALGAFFMRLPFGQYMMGMNVYTGLVVGVTALSAWYFMTYKVKVPALLSLFGEILALSLCWCPTSILYNYLTYLFFTLGMIFLYLGLTCGGEGDILRTDKKSRICLVMAGVFLGANVLVRFPNLSEAALILAVWYACLHGKLKVRDYITSTLWCILGYVVAVGLTLGGIVVTYGLDAYITGIQDLFAMQADAPDYTLYSMVLTVLLDYKTSSRWLFLFLFLAVLCGCIGQLLKHVSIGKRTLFGTKRTVAEVFPVCFGTVLSFLAALGLYKLWVFNVRYYTLESMFQWVAVFLLISIVSLTINWLRPGARGRDKVLSFMLLILIGVTPLGSNNHLYPNMNNMFLVYPYVLWLLLRFVRYLYKKHADVGFNTVLTCFLLIMTIQVLGFGFVFVFRDGMSGQKRDTRITGNPTLTGMITNERNAKAIATLTEFIETENLEDKKVLLYGQIPALSYYLDLEPAISTSWPDLRSYSYEKMAKEMELLGDSDCLILFGAGLQGYLEGDEEAMKDGDVRPETYEDDPKLNLLTNRIETYNYKIVFRNDRFVLYGRNQ